MRAKKRGKKGGFNKKNQKIELKVNLFKQTLNNE